jgi:ATP-binding cassette subfamily B multidrug efflux pump
VTPNIGVLAGVPAQERAQRGGAITRRLLAELSPYRRELLLIISLTLVGALAQALVPWLLSIAIDGSIRHGDRPWLARVMLGVLVAYAINALAMRAQMYRMSFIGQAILFSLRARLFDQLQHLPLRYFDRRPVGDLMSRVSGDVETVSQFFSQSLLQLLASVFSLAGLIIAMLLLNARLALVSLTILPLMFLTTAFVARRARKAFRATRETLGDVTAGLQEEIVGVRESQAFNRAGVNIERFRKRNTAHRDANIGAAGVGGLLAPSVDFLSTLAVAVVVGYGGYLVFRDALSVGLLTAFVIYVQQFFRPIQFISLVYGQLQSSLASGERIYTILDEEHEALSSNEPLEPVESRGQLEFERVSFAYEHGRNVLHEVSFVVRPGETIALVGRTGAGKTTIANLLLRFYDATSGSLRLDGNDVRELERQRLRSRIALIPQEPFIFSGTVAENIGYSRPEAAREEIEAAARSIHAHSFIEDLPQGYDTPLGDGGASLSQGQRQMIAFARALLSKAPILVLDEATSNVDINTESNIEQSLKTVLADRTTIIITHRLGMIRNADQILVIEAGRIVERGTHATLLAQRGLYADMYRHQSELSTRR